VRLDERPIAGLVAADRTPTRDAGPALDAIAFTDGTRLPRRVIFAKPRQRQVPLVERLGLPLDDHGLVQVDDQAATSRPGVHAAGDLASPMQSALAAAAAGAKAAALINHALTLEGARPRPVGAR
jgi:pyruvate/2-oxoglutarate dehydrogenase complex dihydrolipoamide dehydrogenase (E3) component